MSVDRASVAMTSAGVSQTFNVVFRGFPLGTETTFSLVTDSAGVVSELGEFALSPLPQKFSLATDPFQYPLRLSGVGKPGRMIHYGRVFITFLVGSSPRQVSINLTQ